MNKQEFLRQLAAQLHSLPQSEIQKSLDYYEELIDDNVEDGRSEEEAVAALGDPKEIADGILLDAPLTALVCARLKPQHRLRLWMQQLRLQQLLLRRLRL